MIATLLATQVLAVHADPSIAPRAAEATDELARLSHLPKNELSALLADCSASQQNMYFCAWHDQIASELAFKQALAEKKQSLPACESMLDTKSSSWMQSRDRWCEKSATRAWGKGSIQPTAQAICSATETAAMLKRLARIRSCHGAEHRPAGDPHFLTNQKNI